MLSHKEINKLIESLVGEASYDLRREFRPILCETSYEEAMEELSKVPEEDQFLYAITTSLPKGYCEDLNLSLFAAKTIAEKNNQTFVLSLEDGIWKAAYGGVWDCAEYKGANPAYVSCMALLMYMGKI